MWLGKREHYEHGRNSFGEENLKIENQQNPILGVGPKPERPDMLLYQPAKLM